jgi:hypothetical protein
MIGEVNNTRASGSTSIQCDAGVPISGRTSDTGVYNILKVNADGSLPTGLVPEATTNVPYLNSPRVSVLNPVGAFTANTLAFYESVTLAPIVSGVYQLIPMWICATNSAGAVNFALIQTGSAMDTYTSTRNVGTDSFTPAITDFASGFACWWDNNALQVIGSTGSRGTAGLNTQQKEVHLDAGSYKLLVWVHTAFTTSSPIVNAGFLNFTKIS